MSFVHALAGSVSASGAGGPDLSGNGWVMIEEITAPLGSDSSSIYLGTTTNGPWTDYQVLQLRYGLRSTNTTAGTHPVMVLQMGHTGTSYTSGGDLNVHDHYQSSERGNPYYNQSNAIEHGYGEQVVDDTYSVPARTLSHGLLNVYNPNDSDNFLVYQNSLISMSPVSEGNKAGHDLCGDNWGTSDWTNALKNIRVYISGGGYCAKGSYMYLFGLATGSSGS